MESVNRVDPHSELVAELKVCATLLAEKLQSNQLDEASRLMQNMVRASDRHMFQSVGKLTRGLHNAIVNFHVDSDLSTAEDFAEPNINDASSRLNYVIELTQKAAEKTMDMVDEAAPIATNLGQEASALRADWLRLKRREMTPDEFRSLYERMNEFLIQMELGTTILTNNFQNIIVEQGFQDLTGQVLKRVIGLIGGVEKNLVQLVRMASQVEELTGMVMAPAEKQQIEALIEQRKHEPEGPQIDKNRAGVVAGQDDVDDLLSSLGF